MKRKIFSLFLAALGLLSGCSKESKAPFAPPPVPVRTSEIITSDVPLYFDEMGVIVSSCSVEVKPQVQGQITGMFFEEGAEVSEGDLLYTIEEGPYVVKVKEAEAQLLHDTANQENAKRLLERYKSLSNQDFISKVEWDEVETKIALFESMVKADEARLAQAQMDLARCRILAPISGKAGKTALHPGNRVLSDVPLVKIVEAQNLLVDFSLTEKELRKLDGLKSKITLYPAGEEECIGEGEMIFLDHAIDPKTGMIAARARIVEKYTPLFAGQAVRVHVFYGKKSLAKLVPLKAIKTNQEGPYVFTVKEDNTVEQRPVKLGPEEKGLIVVEEGLGEATKVVTEGHLRLFPGLKVEEASQ